MITPKKLIRMAKKWQRLAASRRKRITLPRTSTEAVDGENLAHHQQLKGGHFVVYTADKRRFLISLKYLKNHIISELLRIAEDEFGLPGGGPITLPCDAVFMEYAVSLIQNQVTENVEKALLFSLSTTGGCLASSYLHQERCNQQSLICSF